MKKTTCVNGNKLYLRPLKKEDINKRYLFWLNDADVTRYMQMRFSPPNMIDLKKYYESVKCRNEARMFAIVKKDGDEHIGNIKLDHIDPYHKFADLGIIIGEKKYWGKGYGQEACKLLLKYAFGILKLNKIILGVYSINIPAIKAYEKVGFKNEGRLKNIISFNGRFVDDILMGISKNEFSAKQRDKRRRK